MELGLEGRVALVTGGSRGIGRATAEIFAAERMKVTLTYQRDHEAASRVTSALSRAGGHVHAEQLDLGTPDSIRRAVGTTLDRWGRIDVLVNNAAEWVPVARARRGPFEDFPVAEWQSLMRPNIEGTIAAIQAVLPSMRRAQWGRIVNVSSVAAVDGMPGFGWYAAAKSALHGLTRTLGKELGPVGILINVVMAGGTLTERVRTEVPAAMLEQLAQALPIRRLPTPHEVATVIAFLSSATNTIITGEIIRASGGRR